MMMKKAFTLTLMIKDSLIKTSLWGRVLIKENYYLYEKK